MTKKFWLIALIVACTVVFGSCDKSEELSVRFGNDEEKLHV